MKTLLIRGETEIPPLVREIVRAGSTEVREIGAEEVRDRIGEADRIVVWQHGAIELRDGRPGAPTTRLRWPQDEDTLRLLFQSGG